MAGVAKADIVADYQVSYTYIQPLIEAMRGDHPDRPAFIGRSNLEYMEAFLDRFQKTFGTVEEYLRGIGLTGEEIEALRAKLLRP